MKLFGMKLYSAPRGALGVPVGALGVPVRALGAFGVSVGVLGFPLGFVPSFASSGPVSFVRFPFRSLVRLFGSRVPKEESFPMSLRYIDRGEENTYELVLNVKHL